MLIISLIASCALLLAVNLIARWTQSIPGALLCCVMGLLGLGVCMVVLPAFLLQTLLTVVGGIVCAAKAPRPRPFLLTTVGAFFLAYLTVSVYVWLSLVAMRRATPAESMVERLAYEIRFRPAAAVPPAAAEIRLTSLRSDWAGMFEKGGPGESRSFRLHDRTRSLQLLHENQVSLFVNSPGFGIARIIGPALHRIPLPEEPPIPVNKLSAVIPPESEASRLAGDNVALASDDADHINNLHTYNVVDFVYPIGFGYIKDREHVYGFRSHRFTRPLDAFTSVAQTWHVQRLELVSLLKFDQPAVYLSKHLPRMSELRDAPTRALNAFESAALPRLQRGDDIVIHSTAVCIRVLGAVRATKNCLSCHEGKKGDLLGAFSYQFDPDEHSDR